MAFVVRASACAGVALSAKAEAVPFHVQLPTGVQTQKYTAKEESDADIRQSSLGGVDVGVSGLLEIPLSMRFSLLGGPTFKYSHVAGSKDGEDGTKATLTIAPLDLGVELGAQFAPIHRLLLQAYAGYAFNVGGSGKAEVSNAPLEEANGSESFKVSGGARLDFGARVFWHFGWVGVGTEFGYAIGGYKFKFTDSESNKERESAASSTFNATCVRFVVNLRLFAPQPPPTSPPPVRRRVPARPTGAGTRAKPSVDSGTGTDAGSRLQKAPPARGTPRSPKRTAP